MNRPFGSRKCLPWLLVEEALGLGVDAVLLDGVGKVVLITGGRSPVRPSASRSSTVNAVPLFNSGVVSTAMPRALASISLYVSVP